MCLHVTSFRANELFKDNKSITVYKSGFYNKEYKELISSFYFYSYKIGRNVSSRKTTGITDTEYAYNVIHEGLHVYLHEPDAIFDMEGLSAEYGYNHPQFMPVYFQLTAYKKDYIAHGTNNGSSLGAVFQSLFLSKEEYNKVLEQARCHTFSI